MIGVIVLSAGLGTRLQPLSAWRAKPLVPVGDRPALAHIVDPLRAVARVLVVNAFHRADDVAAFAREAGLVVSREDELLGTGGGIHHAAALLGEGDVLVWNGDMLADLDPRALLDAHRAAARGGARATLAVTPRDDAAGNVGIDARGDVVRLRRETCREGEVRSADFLGIHVIGGAIRDTLRPSGGVIEDGYLPAMRRGERLAVYERRAAFVDIGTPRAYLEANVRWLARRGVESWTGDGAQVSAGAVLRQTVIGAGARVVGAGVVERCVVWPGAVLEAPSAETVTAPEGTVNAGEARG